MAKQRNAGGPAPSQCPSRFTEQGRGGRCSPKRQTRGPARALPHVRLARTGDASAPPAGSQPLRGARARGRGGEDGEEGPAAHFHWWPLGVDPAPPHSPQPFRRSHFRERAEEAGWWRCGQDGGAFADSERLGPSPQVNAILEPGQRRRVVIVVFSWRPRPDPGYPQALPHQLLRELCISRQKSQTHMVIGFHSQKSYPEAKGTHKRCEIPASERGSMSWRKTGQLGGRRPRSLLIVSYWRKSQPSPPPHCLGVSVILDRGLQRTGERRPGWMRGAVQVQLRRVLHAKGVAPALELTV